MEDILSEVDIKNIFNWTNIMKKMIITLLFFPKYNFENG